MSLKESMKTNNLSLRTAIIGAGPAAFFCADYLLRFSRPCSVALFERRPYPFGLVRDAVAPDKPNIRAAAHAFTRTAQHPGFAFFGNVCVGRDLALQDLKKYYHAIIVATGASSPRIPEIQGGSLAGSEDAVSLAGWYNGRPDCAVLKPNLACTSVIIIGAGNAALDIARILATPAAELEHTDISGAAWELLRDSHVTDIHIVARRGPYDVCFAPQELELLSRVPGCGIELHAAPERLEPPATDAAADRMRKAYAVAAASQGRARRVHLHFDMNPVALLGEDKVKGVLFEKPADEFVHIACGMAVHSIGQTACPVAGLPFEEGGNRIPNIGGRVVKEETIIPGFYVAGAVKRGANSVIGANKPDCLETVRSILDDRDRLLETPLDEGDGFLLSLRERGVRVVTFQDWLQIDAWERSRGELKGKPRDRLLSLEAMVAVLDRR